MTSSDSEDNSESPDSGGLPGRHISVHPGNNAFVTAGIIIADVVGAGILSMANAVARFGWFLGAFLILLLLAMNVHISLLMWRAIMVHPEADTYMHLVHAVFAEAPEVQRNLMKWATAFTQYGFMFGMCGIYVLSFGKGIGMLFYTTQICLPIWALVGCALILPFCVTARAMGTWKSLIWLNVMTILGSIVIPLVDMAARGVEATRAEGSRMTAVAEDLNFDGALSGLSTFTFAFTSQFMLVEIVGEMNDKSELPKAYVQISAPFQCMAFLVVGIGGYYYMGDAVQGMIADNIPFGPTFRTASVCLLIHMLIVYQIKCIVLCRAGHLAFHPASADEDSPKAWAVWAALVIAVMAMGYTFANVVPFFSDFVDLLGASVTPICCFVIPILTYLRSSYPVEVDNADRENSGSNNAGGSSLGKGENAAKVPSSFEWVAIGVELTLAVVLTVFGTLAAVRNIMQKWASYGYPFACHCEGLWNTCACSAEHPGMEVCYMTEPREL